MTIVAGDSLRIPAMQLRKVFGYILVEVLELDIELSAFFSRTHKIVPEGKAPRLPEAEMLLEATMIAKESGKFSGTLKPSEPGTVIFRLSNEYSFFTSKK